MAPWGILSFGFNDHRLRGAPLLVPIKRFAWSIVPRTYCRASGWSGSGSPLTSLRNVAPSSAMPVRIIHCACVEQHLFQRPGELEIELDIAGAGCHEARQPVSQRPIGFLLLSREPVPRCRTLSPPSTVRKSPRARSSSAVERRVPLHSSSSACPESSGFRWRSRCHSAASWLNRPRMKSTCRASLSHSASVGQAEISDSWASSTVACSKAPSSTSDFSRLLISSFSSTSPEPLHPLRELRQKPRTHDRRLAAPRGA